METNGSTQRPFNRTSSPVERKKQSNEVRRQVVSFILMVFLTIFAFYAVMSDQISAAFAVPFILVLAIIQVIFQLFVFMHMNQKGHLYPIVFIFSGVFAALLTLIAMVFWVWWS